MSKNELVTMDALNSLLPSVEEIQKVAAVEGLVGNSFLPRLQLITKNKKGVDVKPMNFALVEGQDYTNLGGKVDVMLLSLRPMALQMSPMASVHDPDHSLFKHIQAKALQKKQGHMFGTQFLLWIPAAKTFATFFCGNASLRRETANFIVRMQTPTRTATLVPTMLSNTEHEWPSTLCKECKTDLLLPDPQQLTIQLENFNNPPEPEIEPVEEEETRAQ